MRSVLLLSLTSLSAICQPVDKKLSAWCVYVRNPTRGLLSQPADTGTTRARRHQYLRKDTYGAFVQMAEDTRKALYS